MIVQSIRREGNEIELWMMESTSIPGEAEVVINLPHSKAKLTNMIGNERKTLEGKHTYKFRVRPQQIITMRLTSETSVDRVEIVTDWNPFVPPHKRNLLNKYLPGHKSYFE